MPSLADLLDPDQWIVSGKDLTDFPWPNGNSEREAMKLILSTRPLLSAHMERWSRRVSLWKNISVNCGSDPVPSPECREH